MSGNIGDAVVYHASDTTKRILLGDGTYLVDGGIYYVAGGGAYYRNNFV